MKNKGITLIALVITIIIMLILVAVTVNYTIKSGLIEKANIAKNRTEEETIKEIIGASIVYKITATTINNTAYIDIPKTSVAIYQNLTNAGYNVTSETEKIEIDGKELTGIKISNEAELEIKVKGKHAEYAGKITEKGIEKEIAKVDNNKKFDKYNISYLLKENNLIRSAITIVKENDKIYLYRVDFRGQNMENIDGAEKYELVELNMQENIDKINEYINYFGEDMQININNLAPYCFCPKFSLDSTNLEEKFYYFFSSDYSKLVKDSHGDFEIGEFDYKAYDYEEYE